MVHFCKTCGTLYTDSLGGCPKCNALKLEEEQNRAAQQADSAPEGSDKKTVVRQWIFILIGIPAFILALKLIVSLYAYFATR